VAEKGDSRNGKIEKLEEEIKRLQESIEVLKQEKVPKGEPEPPHKEVRKKRPPKEARREKAATPQKASKAMAEKSVTPLRPQVLKPPSEARKQWLRFERMVGERWLVWVGAIVVAAGFGIFLKYAFEQGWVNEYARIALGVVGGGLLIWFAEFLFKRRFTALAQGMAGLGLIILYLTFFTAFHFYHLFGVWWAFGLFFAITIGGMIIALIHNAYATAFLSIFGGFATPLMLADPTSSAYYEPFLFSYLFIINIGVLFVTSVKRWRAISFTAFLLTLIYFMSWFVGEYTAADFSLAAGFTAAYFVLFSFMSTPQSIIWRRKTRWEDIVLVGLNTVLFLLLGYSLLFDAGYRGAVPYVPLGMALYHLMLAAIIRKVNRQDIVLYVSFMATSIALLTLPVPLLVKSYWITVAWGGEALVLILIGVLMRRKALRIGGAALFILVALRLFTIDSFVWYHRGGERLLFLNLKFLAHFLSVISFGIAASIFERARNVPRDERGIQIPLWIAFLCGLFWVTNHDLFSYFASYSGLAARMMAAYSTVLWTLFFTFLVLYGLHLRNRGLRIAGLCLMMATCVKVLFVDSIILYDYYKFGYPFLLNAKFLSMAIFLFGVALCGIFHGRMRKRGEEIDENDASLVWITFGAMLFLILNIEIFSFFSPLHPDIRLLRFIISTILWTGFSSWFILKGFFNRELKLRITGYVLIGMTAFKFFFIDTFVLYNHPYGLPFVLNLKFLSLILLLALIAVAAKLHVHMDSAEERQRALAIPVLWTSFVSLLFLGLNVEIISFFAGSDVAAVRLESFIFTSMLWALFSLFLVVLGTQRRILALRITGLIILTLTFLKLIIENSTVLYLHSYGFPFLFNLKFLSAFVLLSVVAYLASLYSTTRDQLKEAEQGIPPYLWTLFLVLLFIELHSQAAYSFYRHWHLGEQLAAFAMSLLWATYGFGLLMVGIFKKTIPLRMAALSLFGITLCKVFFVDLRFTGKLYKMFVLMGVGIIFLIAAYFYRRFRPRIHGEEEQGIEHRGGQNGHTSVDQ
jgi:uncharacterized membrane protein